MAVINVVNYLLAPVVTYCLLRLLFPPESKLPSPLPDTYNESVYNWMPAKHPEVICYQKYTPAELAHFDGNQEGGRILLAIMRVGSDGKVGADLERTVFDVSNGRNFYGPGESHRVLDSCRAENCRWDVWQLCRPRRISRYGQAVFRRG